LSAASIAVTDLEAHGVSTMAAQRQELIEAHIDLVRAVAYRMKRRLPRVMDIDDIIQIGMLGLLEAAQSQELRPGPSFVSHATRHIRAAILEASRRSDWCSHALRRRQRAIDSGRWRVEGETGVAARAGAIAVAVGITLEEYFRTLRESSVSKLLSLDEPVSDAAGRATSEAADGGAGPAESLEREAMFAALTAAFDTLPELERSIFLLYYDQKYLMREIGVMLQVSESRICQIHKRAIDRLRSATR
jgi:RNA polymerase sigma factor FliA